jgi:hypothetical protein
MKNPGFQFRFAWRVWAALFAFSGVVLAQLAERPPNGPAAPRTKPQVIYHLPASSEYAATLHSQAKGQNNNPPVDGVTPAPPQIPRENANAHATLGRPETATRPAEEKRIKRAKPTTNRSVPLQSVKTKVQGNSRPNKPHKK